jgi:hypothetical protein
MGDGVPTVAGAGGGVAWAEAWEPEAEDGEAPLAAGVWAVSAGLAAGGLGLCFTFFGVGGGRGTLCADGGGKGEASGVSDFGCCCAVVGLFSVPFPVCNGGACACGGGELL